MKTMNAHKKLGSLLSKAGTNLSLILALLVMSVLFAIMSPHFLTLRNLVNIATYTSINAIMAFGIVIPFTPFGASIGLVALPWSYFPWLAATLTAYCVLTQAIKNRYVKRFNSWL